MARKNKDDAEVTPDNVPVEPAAAVEENTTSVVEAPQTPQDIPLPAGQDVIIPPQDNTPPAEPAPTEEASEVVPVQPGPPAPRLGKLYRGDLFPAIKTPEMVEADRLLQLEHDHKDAVPLEVYFSLRGITDVGAQAARRRSTNVQQATMEKWDEIFKASF